MRRAGAPTPLRLVVMGVSGAGKSTVASALAGRFGLAYVDGDDLHPPANVADEIGRHLAARTRAGERGHG